MLSGGKTGKAQSGADRGQGSDRGEHVNAISDCHNFASALVAENRWKWGPHRTGTEYHVCMANADSADLDQNFTRTRFFKCNGLN